jgi:predicted O-methyltransferase YrrM
MSTPRGYVPGPADLDYIDALHGRLAGAFAALEGEGERDDIPIVDRAVGRILAVLATGRRRILEFGTAYGYSALWMASAMAPDGRLTTIDPDTRRTGIARGHWRAAGIPDDRIAVVDRPALEALAVPASGDDDPLAGPFDLVFIDALKHEYGAYLDAALPRCAPLALVVADNVLWGGNAAGSPAASARGRTPESTAAIRAFNRYAIDHPRLNATIVPAGDGLLLGVVRP